ncbi:Gfo/Idh/MocA family protein [Clavibacter sepedonicus]|uniref:Oxidoreductase n=1 Tax=Clavibacter sepedonicus TaxID=31964 RepID=B0RG41_CLASE|nr:MULTISPECIES: Gfo/Idh/MocA family oxidoreductase [Clavibacter]MBD5383294.1 Gfo/Idh/MocA family oxidoreductase [Clavibacter sp.]OQJ47929.1 oxidoreductase [Clavibacter sepedonicus]OQJ53486.1 oxidoreductase [Clavibacter sepedonicus]UUK66406.1 Gfo/Idh/MocA family oxidoreductase [Clavibacter sepedonicus]CAQ02332.1 putative oxidoreductase [Clavibacter sepedonicus]
MRSADVALLGYGAMGRAYHRLLRTHPDLVPLVGRLHVGSRRAPEPWEPLDDRDAVGTLDDALAEGPPAVIIATPPPTHEALAHRALDLGAHVLVEKPAALTGDGIRALNRHADAAGRSVQVVSQLRQVAAWGRARDRIRAGALGIVRSALVDIPLWRSDAYFAASPARSEHELANLAYHELDLAIWCLGPVDGVTVVPAHVGAGEDRATRHPPFTAVLEQASGCLTTLRYTTRAFPGRAPRVTIDGTAGSLVLESGAAVVDLAPPAVDVPDAGLYARQTSVPEVDPDWLAPHAAQLRGFLADPSRTSPRRIDETSVRTTDLIHRIQRHLNREEPA